MKHVVPKAHKIVILGGGFAGVGVAKRLLKLRNKDESLQIMLVDKNTYQTYTASLYEVATGYGSEDKHFSETAGSVVGIPYSEMFKGGDISIFSEDITKIDVKRNEITTHEGSVLRFDYCVVALGTQTNFFDVSGAEKYSYPLKFFNDAVSLHKKLHTLLDNMKGGKKHIIVVGGGFSGVETAGELSCCLGKLCIECNISPKDITVTIVEGGETILSGADKRVVYAAEKRLRALGINIITNQRVAAVSTHDVTLGSGEKLRSDLTVWATGVRVPKIVVDIPGLEHGKRGRIVVDKYLRAKGTTHIFALGDNALYTDGKTKEQAPGTASIAVRQAPIVAENVFRTITEQSLKEYNLNFPGFVVPVGGKFVIAQIGNIVLKGFSAHILHQIITWKYYLSVLPFTSASRMLIRGSRLFSQND